MTPPEAVAFLGRMMTLWPHSEIPDPTVREWLADLEAMPLARAEAALHQCKQTCEWFPSFAAFHKAGEETARQRAELARTTRELPALEEGFDRDAAKARLAEVRSRFRAGAVGADK